MRAVLLLLVSVVASVAVAEEIALKDWIVAPAVPTAPCVCNGVGPVPSNTTPCFCYNGVYEYTAPNTLLGSFLSPTSHNPPVIDFDPSYSENVNNISNTPFWKVPWWFNTTTTVPPSAFALLVFHGINYRADVLVNEHTIVTSDDLVGTFRRFAYDISKYATGSPINIAVRVYGPVDHSFANSTDLAITFVDWNPEPADRTMGIIDKTFIVTRDVPIDATGLSADTVLTDDTFQTSLSFVLTTYASTASLAGAQLRLRLSCVDHALVIPFPASKNAFETRFFFNASDFKELRGLPKKLLWNPWQLGEPTMHALSLEIVDEASQATLALVDFERIGFRQVTAHLDRFGSRQFVVNGHPFLIRGGGWSPDMFYRANDTLLQQQFNLVRDMRLNAIRLEGKFMWDGFFSLADRMGLLVMPGWCCCDSWQHWDEWGPEQFLVSRESLRSQLRRLAHHPSVMMFFYSSDELPPAAVERNYLAVFAEEYWPNPTVSSASATPSNITGPSGVKMSGPYAWVPPAYWLLDSNESFADRGGAWGFLTEGGPGAAPLTLSSWNATVPSTDLWSPEGLMGDAFSFHCASPKGWFRNLRYFAPALDARYGKSDNVVAALYRSQVQTYEGMRAMFEGYTKNKHQGATGVIQWMMNNAWPSHMWHLFDFYLSAAGGSYYGAKKACEEVHAMYSYADRTISVINSLFQDVPFSEQDPLTITVTIRGIGGDVHWARNETVVYPLAGDAVLTFWAVPEVDMEFYFVRVTWESQRVPLGVNDYWLGQQMDVLNWTDSHWYITHVSQYANFSGLSGLQPASIAVVNLAWGVDPRGGLNVSFAVENNLSGVAFAVSVTPVRDGDVDVNPAMMSDSYITLLGFETRRINGWLPWATAADIPHLSIKIQSYNNQVLHQ